MLKFLTKKIQTSQMQRIRDENAILHLENNRVLGLIVAEKHKNSQLEKELAECRKALRRAGVRTRRGAA